MAALLQGDAHAGIDQAALAALDIFVSFHGLRSCTSGKPCEDGFGYVSPICARVNSNSWRAFSRSRMKATRTSEMPNSWPIWRKVAPALRRRAWSGCARLIRACHV